MPHDRWGEPIDVRPRTFSLATLLRGVTLVAVVLGWLSLVRTHPGVAGWLVVGAAACLSKVIGQRQQGRPWEKVAAGTLYFVLALLVGSYVHSWLKLLMQRPRHELPDHWTAFDAIFLSCLGAIALPVMAALALILLRWWTWLASVAAESRQVPSARRDLPAVAASRAGSLCPDRKL